MGDPAFPLLDHLPAALIRECYERAPGNEITSGKFASPESSAALAANVWGYFLSKPDALPPLPGQAARAWQVQSVSLEALEPFPWSGGRRPCLDARIETAHGVVGVESKRYEPFRTHADAAFSDAYWRPVWGRQMRGYCAVRDRLRADPRSFVHLDAAQLVKHAFGLRTGAAQRATPASLLYVFAEPGQWPGGAAVSREAVVRHRAEAAAFAKAVAGDEVLFHWCSYRDLLEGWRLHPPAQAHAEAVLAAFAV